MKKQLVTLLLAVIATTANAQIPGLKGGDHIGLTVPNLDEATRFFVDVIGCQAFYDLGPFAAKDNWMEEHLNVHPRAQINKLRTIRCGNGLNLELFEYSAPGQVTTPPRNSDIGGNHIAFYVQDITTAVDYLKKHGVKVLGHPSHMTEGPSAGESWVYFLAPWGQQLELVSYPNGKAYEQKFQDRLWDPRQPISQKITQ